MIEWPDIKSKQIRVDKQAPVDAMCQGCGNRRPGFCKVIIEPGWIYKHRGTCFAKVTKERAMEIEVQISEEKKRRILK